MISFAELTKQVHLINDLILSDMVCDPDNAEEAVIFSKHLLATKFWFARISYINKKRYLLVLLQDTRSAWTLSLLLKSMWNCRPKDAVMSVSERGGRFSCYDQVPMDHNRTALPVTTLSLTMKTDRMWYLSLEPDAQALVLSELLTIAGGPAMWAVLCRAQTLYKRYQEQLLQNLRDCIVVSESLNQKSIMTTSEKTIKRVQPSTTTGISESVQTTSSSRGQKNLEANLATWNATIKAMRESLKLEELEMTFNDGTKRKIWKVNRVKPDVMETVDFVQLLPSDVAKRILFFLPRANLGDYARVNKYWAYLVDEYRSEIAARTKIDADYTKLEEIVIKHDESLYEFITQHDLGAQPLSSIGMASTQQPTKVPQKPTSMIVSVKSGVAYSLRYFSDKLNKPIAAQTPIRNIAELNERMEIRGAADENIWKWCGNIVAQTMRQNKKARDQRKVVMKGAKKAVNPLLKSEETKGILTLTHLHFPCPLMKYSLVVPLKPPLFKDPALIKPSIQKKRCLSNASLLHAPRLNVKRYRLWTRDKSPLYPVFKIPSYQLPANLLSL